MLKMADKTVPSSSSAGQALGEDVQQASAAPAAIMHPAQGMVQSMEDINVDPQLRDDDLQTAINDGVQSRDEDEWHRRVLRADAIMTQQQQEEHTGRFLDRQPGAQRVEFGDGFSQEMPDGPSSTALGKCPARDGDEGHLDLSQDASFQTDDRNTDIDARRRLLPVGQSRSLQRPSTNKRALTFTSTNRDDDAEPNLDEEETDDQFHALPTRQPNYYATVRELAKVNRKCAAIPASLGQGVLALPTASAPGHRDISGPSKRSWSEEETEALIAYISELGCSWAQIKRHDDMMPAGPILGQWSQVDLKDKAIGIKTHYLQSRVALPPNFEGVSLRKRDKERLIRMGITGV